MAFLWGHLTEDQDRPRPDKRNGEVHHHKCDGCGTVWEHKEDMRGDDAAHTCQQCGNQVYHRFYPDDPEQNKIVELMRALYG